MSTYECGADPVLLKSSTNTLPFFQTVIVYLVFELEISVLFLAFPVLSLLSSRSLVYITVFVFLVQLGTLFEIRGGISKWVGK
jgi:NADH:ubiquinone oxidoreductase subunit 3 (subunit A)